MKVGELIVNLEASKQKRLDGIVDKATKNGKDILVTITGNLSRYSVTKLSMQKVKKKNIQLGNMSGIIKNSFVKIKNIESPYRDHIWINLGEIPREMFDGMREGSQIKIRFKCKFQRNKSYDIGYKIFTKELIDIEILSNGVGYTPREWLKHFKIEKRVERKEECIMTQFERDMKVLKNLNKKRVCVEVNEGKIIYHGKVYLKSVEVSILKNINSILDGGITVPKFIEMIKNKTLSKLMYTSKQFESIMNYVTDVRVLNFKFNEKNVKSQRFTIYGDSYIRIGNEWYKED